MKWKRIIFGACVSLVLLIGNVRAESRANSDYIVYLKSPPVMRLMQTNKQTAKRNYITVSESELTKFLSENTVEFYEPNYEINLFESFSALQSEEQWNLENIRLSKAWEIGCYGNDVKVGVIDSGVYAHPDLTANLIEGHNYLTGTDDTNDNIGHGTFVSGIIAAEANNEYIDGIAYHAKIVPLKCFDNGYETKVSMIADAIYDAIDEYGCKVINMSFGMSESYTSKTLQLAIKYAQQNGCILVASVGNDGNGTVYYPANYDGVVGVGSVDKDNNISWFSQMNSTVDVVAPGQGLISVSILGFKDNSGTSFSAPHVSAMAAIAKCIDENITPTEFQNILQATSTQLANSKYNISYGYGLINIEGMVDMLLENTKVFMSPVSTEDYSKTVKIYNNNTTRLDAVGIVADYENSHFCGFDTVDISLPPGETKELKYNKNNKVKFMLWSDFKTLTPLTKQREY